MFYRLSGNSKSIKTVFDFQSNECYSEATGSQILIMRKKGDIIWTTAKKESTM